MKKILIWGAAVLYMGVGAPSYAELAEVSPQTTSEPSTGQDKSVQDRSVENASSPKVVLPPVEITVLDQGAEPRQVLRLQSKVGDKQRSRMRMTTQPKILVDGEPFPGFEIPPIELTTEMETLSVEPDGSVRVKFSYLEPQLDESQESPAFVTAMLKQQFELLSQASIYFVYDPQGRLKETEVEFDGDETTELGKLLQQISASTQQSSGMFPDEAIGIGAVWSAPQSASVNGITIRQNIVYKLLDVQGDRVTLSMSLDLDGEGTDIDVSQRFPLPPDVKAEMSSVDMTGAGTMTLSLTQLLATAMNLDNHINMEMIFTDPKKTTTINMDMTSNIQILEE